MGQALYMSNCTSCHAADGTGGLGPNLHNNAYIQSQSDEDLAAFLLVGRRGTPMNGFEGILAEEDLRNLVSFLRSWQD
jgi:cytochrome c oxidase cbb3-type subunit 3